MIRTMPTRATIGEKLVGLSIFIKMLLLSMPARLRIQAVSVVPMLEPIMTPTVCPSSMIPEFTSPTSITVIAEELWMAMVIPAPKSRLLKGLDGILFNVCSSFPPVTFVSPEDITCMPYRKNASPPQSVMRLKISMSSPVKMTARAGCHSCVAPPGGIEPPTKV